MGTEIQPEQQFTQIPIIPSPTDTRLHRFYWSLSPVDIAFSVLSREEKVHIVIEHVYPSAFSRAVIGRGTTRRTSPRSRGP